MVECNHPQLTVNGLTVNAGRASQRHFHVIRCTKCGGVFPANPEPEKALENQLVKLNHTLEMINTNIADIKLSLRKKN